MVIKRAIIVLFTLFFVSVISRVSAQNITIEVERDTISLEEKFQVKYTIDDACDASDLKFENFIVVAGPSVSRSISIVNGKRTAESSYTVVLTAIEEGTFPLPDKLCDVKMEKPLQIVVKNGYESKETLDERIRSTRKVKKI